MENKLEQLLKRLLELGRKPNGKEYNHVHAEANRIMSDFGTFYRFCNYVENGSINRCLNLKLREIVSVNSGLWQFCCENGMVDRYKYDSKTYEVRIENWIKRREIGPEGEVSINNSWRGRGSAEYRLIESSLCDEDKLEDFILENIKIGNED